MLFCSEAFIQALIAYLGEASEPNKEEIVAALMQYLKTPSVFTVQNVIGLPAVTILKGHWMHTLLSLFQAGNLADYDKFYAGLPAGTISPADHELLRRKVRLISLAALAAQHINGELSYDAVSKALLIDEAEVEMVVIDGTRARAAMCFFINAPHFCSHPVQAYRGADESAQEGDHHHAHDVSRLWPERVDPARPPPHRMVALRIRRPRRCPQRPAHLYPHSRVKTFDLNPKK